MTTRLQRTLACSTVCATLVAGLVVDGPHHSRRRGGRLVGGSRGGPCRLDHHDTRIGGTSLFAAAATTQETPVVQPPLKEASATRRAPIEVVALHRDPAVLLARGVLSQSECDELIRRAEREGLERSPVQAAGWSDRATDLVRLAARGPALWAGLGAILATASHGGVGTDRLALAASAIAAYSATMLLAFLAAAAWTLLERRGLERLRTSTSVALTAAAATVDAQEDESPEVRVFRALAGLVQTDEDAPVRDGDPRKMEALTVIKYAPGQALAPHFDANPSPEEDAARGGQTLATLLVYLNDVTRGGQTRFGRLGSEDGGGGLLVDPRAGDACLFFPSRRDDDGRYYRLDERLEHEGLPPEGDAVKYIARVWLHEHDVPAPQGLAGTPTADHVARRGPLGVVVRASGSRDSIIA